jgi:hypothetical protein
MMFGWTICWVEGTGATPRGTHTRTHLHDFFRIVFVISQTEATLVHLLSSRMLQPDCVSRAADLESMTMKTTVILAVQFET